MPEPRLESKIGEKVSIDVEADTLRVECRGDVMTKIPAGYGIRYLSVSNRAKRDIRHMISKLFPFCYQVTVLAKWITEGQEICVAVLDISYTGFYLQADIEGMSEVQEGHWEIPV